MDPKERLERLKDLAFAKELDDGFPSQRACIDWSDKVAGLLRFRGEYYEEFTASARYISVVGLSADLIQSALNNMISVVRRAVADLEAGENGEQPVGAKETPKVSQMKLKERIENHPVIIYAGVAIVGFGMGIGADETFRSWVPRQPAMTSAAQIPAFLDERIRQLSNAHEKRIAALQAEYLSDLREAINIAHADSNQENYRRAAEAIGQQIDKENSSFAQQISALRAVASK